MRRCLLLVVVALALAFAPAPLPKPGPSKDDLKRMQGEWEFVRSAARGPDPWFPHGGTVSKIVITKMVISGDRLTRSYDQGWGEVRVTASPITLDARRTPKVLVVGGDLVPCIYCFDGDTLTLCFHPEVRPRNFGGPGPGEYLEVWKRKKR
jgi:uncharacterized protein (TIGR03067 family)